MTAAGVRVRTGVATHVGTVREVNEDSVLVAPRVFVVADGMGGHAAGDVASAITVRRMERLAGRRRVTADDVRAELAAANADVLAAAARDPGRAGMGTTVAGLAIVDAAGSPHWALFNIGDSRVYRLANGRMRQLTTDHSEVAELIEAGVITKREALTHPLRHVVTRAVGMRPGPAADLWVFPPTAGERFLICSDGLPLELPDHEIAAVLTSTADPQEAADALVARAVAAGGRDNVSVVIVDSEASARPSEDAAVTADPPRAASADDTAPRARPTPQPTARPTTPPTT
jgi:PPM family protein phosphatase